ncbi:hypothetical protein N7517_009257 [Penicillium concentricum]|uniref:Uncharacterized protein n=1 Tax=Penicillium concentricum TaxID=293559 RepID=A0A9W9RH79_9EURO|nr:uncharacterized protein N7517_009257 [Penicillium concentricum]KAJ5360066.1 hypothetical protein N7517_009257 [Penicillium concentricum]
MLDEPMDPAYIWPLVLLADLSAPSQAMLIGRIQQTLNDDLELRSDDYFGAAFQEGVTEVKVRPWSPPPRLLESIARQGPCRDSQSNLHALAVLAYRSGRPRIIVADEATKRQLSGKYLPDADLMSGVISIILLSTCRDTQSDRLSVFARRAICSAQKEMFNLDDIDFLWSDHDPQPSGFRSVHKAWGPLWAHAIGWRGLTMHDPNQEPFTSRPGDIAGREYYANAVVTTLSRHLPMELAVQVSNTHSTPIRMPVWKRRPGNTHLVIFLLYDTTAQELEKTQQTLQESLPAMFPAEKMVKRLSEGKWISETEPWYTETPDMTLELIPWDRHRMKTRLDLMDFWEEYRLWDAELGARPGIMPLIFLRKPLSDLDEAQFNVLTIKSAYPSPVAMRHMVFGDLCTDMERFGCVDAYRGAFENGPRKKGAEEELWHPEQPFFINPPTWLPAIRTNWIRVVFSLTNQLTEAGKQSLKGIMLAFDESDGSDSEVDSRNEEPRPEYSFIHWKSDTDMVDGKVKDIWDIVQDLHLYPKTSNTCPLYFICVDRQFEIDQTVIQIVADEYKSDPGHDLLHHLRFPGLRGFRYMRVPAHLAYSENKNRLMDHGTHLEWSIYRREGWPAPGMLPDDLLEVEAEYVNGEASP